MENLTMLTKVIVITTMCICASATFENRKEESNRPHIITIIADDMGWNDVSFHGSDQIPTPNIDALAYYGVNLKRHYVLPTCTPSRTAYLTGRYPIRAGMQGFPLKAGEPRGIPLETTLLPEHLQNLGYRTRLVGKWHVGYYTKDHTPAHRGFDSFFGYYSGYVKYFDHTISQSGQVGYDLHRDSPVASEVEYTTEYLTDAITSEAENIIANHNDSTPLYLQLAHIAPHAGEDEDLLEVHNMTEVNATLGYIEDIDRRKYAGMVTRLDQSVGRVVASLKNAGMLENSIILFMSDNGAQTEGLHENHGSNYPLRGLKFTLFEGGVRGAACIYSPLITNSSRVSDQLLHITDWLPTLYSAAGGDVSDLGDVDGVDQWSALIEGGESGRDSLLLNIDEKDKLEGAVFGRFKLIKGAAAIYGDYYGDSGVDKSYPSYNVTAVLSSDAGQAIASIYGDTVSIADKIAGLRDSATISCDGFSSYANCSVLCLFDLAADPCETSDISEDRPEVVANIENFIDEYRAELMNQTNADVDPASYPSNFNGTWMPWMETESSASSGDASSPMRKFVELLLLNFW